MMRPGWRVCVAALMALAFCGEPRAQSPSAFDVVEKSIDELQRALQAGDVTSRQLVDLYLARIDAYDQRGPTLNAIVAVNARARDAAAALDAERAAGKLRGPLHGIPLLVKDNYETVEMPTTAGSIALASFHPASDATLVRRLKDAGAIILAKTTMHELAAGITTVGSRFGQTRNPYDLDRTPGGSSGGTGAAVAANFAAGGLGSDTCGSIRIPAANNNLVGLRGTQGLSSRAGIVPLSSSQDIGGPIARSIMDLAIMLDATVGADLADAQTQMASRPTRTAYRERLGTGALTGVRIGVVRSLFGSGDDQEVAAIVSQSLERLGKAGATVIDVTVPGLDDLLRDSSLINADFKFDLAAYLGAHPDAPVKSLGEILDRGLYHRALDATFRARNAVERRDSDQARRAKVKQAALRHALQAVLDEHQLVALVHPTLRRKPARIGEAQAGTVCQVSAHSGLPALAVPAGFTDDDVPIGMEFLGRAFSEAELLALGYGIERTLDLRRAPFSTPRLASGKAPAARVLDVPLPPLDRPGGKPSTLLRLSYDESTGRLDYTLTAADALRAQLTGVWLHGGTVDKPGAGRHQLYGGGQGMSGTLVITALDRRELAATGMLLRVFTRTLPPVDVVVRFAAR